MNLMKSLYLGSAAGLVVMSGAHAADLPLKAKAVEYVKVCSLYGAGFYYIPGTDTCIKLGGYMRADMGINTNTIFQGNTGLQAGAQNRSSNAFTWRARSDLTIDTRTATDYGVVRTFFEGVFTWTSGGYQGLRVGGSAYDGNPNGGVLGGQLGVFHAFIQFAGFTIGKAASQFSAPWGQYPGNVYDGLVGGGGALTGVNQFTYTTEFGNGVSASIGAQDPSAYYQPGIQNLAVFPGNTALDGLPPFFGPVALGTPFFGYGLSAYGGTTFPDIVGQLRVDQAWGMFQASLAAHHNNPAYYTGVETGGGPGGKWGWAGQAALSIKNIPTGPGDVINISGVYTNGATRYNIHDMTALAGANTIYGGSGISSIGFGFAPDSVYAPNGQLQLVSTWGMRGAYTHHWNPYWSSSVFGAYAAVSYTGQAKSYMCGVSIPRALGAGFTSCNPDFNIAQVGANLRWTPVKNLTFTTEGVYSMLDQKHAGVANVPNNWAVYKQAGGYQLKDQDIWTVMFRAQRTW